MQDRTARHEWFKAVILPHESALRRRVRRLATTPDVDVDDIVSEALIRAYQVEDYARIDRGRAFLFSIARHLMADLARHRAVIPFELMASLEVFDLADPALRSHVLGGRTVLDDGVKDGIISNPPGCKFDPAQLICIAGTKAKPGCLTKTQAEAAQKSMLG